MIRASHPKGRDGSERLRVRAVRRAYMRTCIVLTRVVRKAKWNAAAKNWETGVEKRKGRHQRAGSISVFVGPPSFASLDDPNDARAIAAAYEAPVHPSHAPDLLALDLLRRLPSVGGVALVRRWCHGLPKAREIDISFRVFGLLTKRLPILRARHRSAACRA